MVTVFILEKHIRRQFFEYTYKVKFEKFQLLSFRRSAVTNENGLGGMFPFPPPPPETQDNFHKQQYQYETKNK